MKKFLLIAKHPLVSLMFGCVVFAVFFCVCVAANVPYNGVVPATILGIIAAVAFFFYPPGR